MFLEDPQIDLPYSVDAVARRRSVHGFPDQGVSLCVGDTRASPSDFFHIDDYAEHAHPESGSRLENLAHCAFSSAVSDDLRILGKIRQFGTISLRASIAFLLPWAHGHPLKAMGDFVAAIIEQQTACQAQLARDVGKQEAAVKR
jgi:hypothetical protein